ncbi:MAG: phosphate ABC transporter substrate-binding protein PstS [Spirochaetales bacterium]|nr:phosphate ABC transporter substrate-binding protein PstS [Spirochaetales bacterium]
MKKFLIILTILSTITALVSATGSGESGPNSSQPNTKMDKMFDLSGAGATFPAPLYTVMFDEYSKLTGNKVNYQAIGSGGGIKQLTAKTVNFGASDAPMKDSEIAAAGAEVIHIPTCIGAIVISYNLTGIDPQLRFDGTTIANVFLGKITKWNDPAITALNPGVKLPDMPIAVIHRSDSSGTSYNFTTYLTKVSPEWAAKIGTGKSPDWPVGVGGQGNPGVAANIKQVPGALGYIEIAYARQNKMPVAQIKNKAGNFIDPGNLSAVALAADVKFPADAKVDIVDSDAAQGYPISATTWLLIYKDQTFYGNKDKCKAVVDLFWWITHDGQKFNETVDYAKLPPAAVKVAENLLKSIVYDGKPFIQ